ncbi:hypothetical protein H6G33_37490 [Calothrix sp. FACHB-1219]|uniref:hypothetical protein n=1 Tax=unclassified Calothrix TaxID=2619626 RepID=UPI001686F14B|nr:MULTISPECIES: hypothetical protein [unclassified Calothrix]MBD2208085.1 hypothetical protein [Calothrix sp. FACHB-168]MBD2222623.1 hypothetical protein [Calothrix sp. FACHB-1219]
MKNHEEIRQELEGLRKKALADYIQEFIPILEQERYSLDDLLDAIASYIHYSVKKPGHDDAQLDVVVRKLEEAAQEYRDFQKYDQSSKDSSPD